MTSAAPQPSDLLERAASGAFIVTAGRRLARILHLHYAAHQRNAARRAWPTPHILPWPAWIESLWNAALYEGLSLPARLSVDQELLVWEGIIQLDADRNQLLDPAAAAEAARTSWELMHAWRLDRRAIEAFAGEDTRAFLDWARRFEQESEREDWLEPARQPDYLIPLLERIPLPSPILLAGFDELTPQQQAFFQACERCRATVELLQHPSRTPSLLCRIGLPDRTREFEAAARWARGLLESGAARSVAVVVPDLENVRSEVERVFTRLLEPACLLPGSSRPRSFDIAAPPPLPAHPLVRAAVLLLELERDRNPIRTVSRLLRSPYLHRSESERAPRALLEMRLRERGIAEISVRRLLRACRQARPPCLALRRALRLWLSRVERLPTRQPPSAWARDFIRLLRALGWPGERTLSSEEYQAYQAFYAVLARLASLDRVKSELTRAAALALLRRLLARTPHQPHSEPAPIHILGVLETAGLQFDALWICGLDEESWPAPPAPDPFIPLALQRERNLPHASPQREHEFARRALERLLASAPRVVASWAHRVHDEDRAPSPLIATWHESSEAELLPSECPDYLQILAQSGSFESREEAQAPPLRQHAWSRGGVRVFRYQALCPFRAFAELRLGATRLRFPHPGIAPLDRGQAVHAALEHIWSRLHSWDDLIAAAQDDIEALLESAAQHAIDRLQARRTDLSPGLLELERLRLKRLLCAWLEREKNREPFRIVALEQKREIEIAGIRATVKVDRVDCLPDGREIIIDYKTGECSLRDWWDERPEDPQLPLYAITHPNPLAALFFAQLKTGQLDLKGLHADYPTGRNRPRLSQDILSEWRTVLERLAAQFCEGRANVDPKRRDATCRTCGLEALCRVRESGVEPLEQEEDEQEA